MHGIFRTKLCIAIGPASRKFIYVRNGFDPQRYDVITARAKASKKRAKIEKVVTQLVNSDDRQDENKLMALKTIIFSPFTFVLRKRVNKSRAQCRFNRLNVLFERRSRRNIFCGFIYR